MIQKGTSKKVIITHLSKLPENKLKVIDTKTGKLIKNIESTSKDIELKVVKTKKPKVDYKEVKVGNDQVQLQRAVQKQVKTVVLTKSELKALNKLNTEAKTLTKTKPVTATAVRTKTKQLQKARTQIKAKQKVLLLYQQKLKTLNTEQKQKVKTLTLLASKQTGVQKSTSLLTIKSATKQIHSTASVLASISSIIAASKMISSTITTAIQRPTIPIVVVPIIGIPIKTPAKNKEFRVSSMKEVCASNNGLTIINSIDIK